MNRCVGTFLTRCFSFGLMFVNHEVFAPTECLGPSYQHLICPLLTRVFRTVLMAMARGHTSVLRPLSDTLLSFVGWSSALYRPPFAPALPGKSPFSLRAPPNRGRCILSLLKDKFRFRYCPFHFGRIASKVALLSLLHHI